MIKLINVVVYNLTIVLKSSGFYIITKILKEDNKY